MKKAISLLLITAFLIGLCACSTSKQLSIATQPTGATTPTDVGVNQDALAAKYEKALYLLVEDPMAWDGAKMLFASRMQQAYDLFAELATHNYKDAADYLARFTVLTDVLLYDTLYETGENGEAVLVSNSARGYHYTKEGLLYCRYDDLLDTAHYYSYDAEGPLSQTQQYTSGEPGTTVKYTYDNGLLVQQQWCNGDRVDSSTDYTYDDMSKLVKTNHRNEKNSDWETIFSYDENGMLMQEICTVVDSGITYTCSYSYDEAGVLTQSIQEKSDPNNADANSTVTTVYTYSDGRLICETSTTADQEGSSSRIYVYGDYYCYTLEK